MPKIAKDLRRWKSIVTSALSGRSDTNHGNLMTYTSYTMRYLYRKSQQFAVNSLLTKAVPFKFERSYLCTLQPVKGFCRIHTLFQQTRLSFFIPKSSISRHWAWHIILEHRLYIWLYIRNAIFGEHFLHQIYFPQYIQARYK